MCHQQLNRGFAALTLAAALAGVAGCTGQGITPTAPVIASGAPASTISNAPRGAIISGTVVGVSSRSSVGAQAISLSVTVTGSSSSSIVDNNGRFTLTGVPAGHVDLHFTGPGVDAHLGLDGVPEHATIVITVRVTGSDAHLEGRQGDDDDDDDGEAELSGTIASGSLSGSCAGHNLSFMIGTTKVTTNTSTKFSDGTCESLKAGSRVEVKGTRQTDVSILAASVEGDGEDENEDPEDEVELEGAILAGSIGGACSTYSLSFKVGSTTVRTNAATEFKNVSCASLKAGDSVEVKGSRQPDASVIASRVKREK